MGSGSRAAFLLAHTRFFFSLRGCRPLCHIQVTFIVVRWWGDPTHQVGAFLLNLCPESLVFATSRPGVAEGMLIRWESALLFLWHAPVPLLAGIYGRLCALCVRWTIPGAAGGSVGGIKTFVITLKLLVTRPVPRLARSLRCAFALHQRTTLPAWMLRAALLTVVR